MSKALYCEYCKRFCDERCLKCIYMKEAELKEKEDNEDEKKMESKESEERQNNGSRGTSDFAGDFLRILSSADYSQLITLKAWIDNEFIVRRGLEEYIGDFLARVFAHAGNDDPNPLLSVEEKLLKYINEEGGK